MNVKKVLAVTGLMALGLVAAGSSLGATRAEIDKRVAATLAEFNNLNPSHQALGKKAAGMLVFPRVTKGGVGVAAEYGEGALQVNGKTVGYYNIGAASVGATLGVASHSEIVMFMTKESLSKFQQSDGWAMGADAGVTVVSTSAGAEIDTLTRNKPVLAFAFNEKGLIGDLSVEGSKITRIKE